MLHEWLLIGCSSLLVLMLVLVLVGCAVRMNRSDRGRYGVEVDDVVDARDIGPFLQTSS